MLLNAEQDLNALWKGLKAFVSARISDNALAEDLTQDVFVKALRSMSEGKNIQRLDAWMYQVARTTIVDYYRAKGDSAQPLEEDFPEQAPELFDEHQQLAACLAPFVARLPDKYRSTLVDVDINKLPLKTVAEREGISLSAVKSRASRGRKMLRELVLDCCHVELENGLVSDYYRQQKPSDCCKRA